MTTTINASTSSGLIQTADTSGVLQLQSNGTSAAGVSGSDFQMNSGYGSVATAYGCRAWVNFNGSGTPAIRASGNVSSITDNGLGDYTVNFTTAMPDVNYSVTSLNRSPAVTSGAATQIEVYNTTSVRFLTLNSSYNNYDAVQVSVAIFR